jgi:hypothetical protein
LSPKDFEKNLGRKRVFALVGFVFPANNCHFCKIMKIEEKRLSKRHNKKRVGYVFFTKVS